MSVSFGFLTQKLRTPSEFWKTHMQFESLNCCPQSQNSKAREFELCAEKYREERLKGENLHEKESFEAER